MKIRSLKKAIRKETNAINIPTMSTNVKSKAKAYALENEVIKYPKINVKRKPVITFAICMVALLLIVIPGIRISRIISIPKNNGSVLTSAKTVGTKTNLMKLLAPKYTLDIDFDNNIFNLIGNGGAKYYDGDYYILEARPNNSASDNEMSGSSNSSNTISQVEGIQEGEIIKTDDKHIYYIYQDTLDIYDIDNGKTNQVKRIKVDNELYRPNRYNYYGYGAYNTYYDGYYACGYSNVSMYVTDVYLILVYEKIDISEAMKEDEYYYNFDYFTSTVVEIYDKVEFECAKKIVVPGTQVDERVYNNHLYLVSADYIEEYELNPVCEYVDDETIETEVDLNTLLYFPSRVSYALNYICSINLDNLVMNTETQLGNLNYGYIYMSTNALYLCDSSNYSDTCIYKYAFDEEYNLKYASNGVVKGHPINQYSLDEYNGYLRIVVTDRYYYDDGNINAIFVLKETDDDLLEIVGKLEKGLGEPWEKVKSVKFNGDYVSVVTFRNTDPLYLIKFTDDVNIEIVDYLKVPGYSTFLQDITINGENYKIGIGYDGGNYKLSLYKEENDTVKEVGNSYLIARYHNRDFQNAHVYEYVTTEAADNIKAMLLYQDSDDNTFIGINLDIERNVYRDYNNECLSEGKYLLLRINLNNKDDVFETFKEFTTTSFSSRMVVVNGYYYLVSSNMAKGYQYNPETDTLELVK